jgi:hypothetical protein
MSVFQFVTGLFGFNALPKANIPINTRKNKQNLNKNFNNRKNLQNNIMPTNNAMMEIPPSAQPSNKPNNLRANVSKNINNTNRLNNVKTIISKNKNNANVNKKNNYPKFV